MKKLVVMLCAFFIGTASYALNPQPDPPSKGAKMQMLSDPYKKQHRNNSQKMQKMHLQKQSQKQSQAIQQRQNTQKQMHDSRRHMMQKISY